MTVQCTCAADTFVWVRVTCRRCGRTWETLHDAAPFCAVHHPGAQYHETVDSCRWCEEDEGEEEP